MPFKRWPGMVCLLMVLVAVLFVSVAGKPADLPGWRAIVIDERHSVLRERPNLKGPVRQRLRSGRIVGVLGTVTDREGNRFSQIAISRNIRGWMLASAIVRPGNRRDAARLLALIESTSDDHTRIRLAGICAEHFRASAEAPRALMIIAEAATRVAQRLTRDARRRAGLRESDSPVSITERRAIFLNFNGLDRYNRLGVLFDYDAGEDRLVYDGAALHTLRRRYPRYEPLTLPATPKPTN